MSRQEWRAACMAAAQAQAAAEGQRAWTQAASSRVAYDYRWEHVAQVTALAMLLAQQLGADLEIVEAAAWLHDVRKEQPSHGVVGAVAAREILAATDFPPAKIDAVADAIGRHVGMTRPPGAPPLSPLEAAILWDADKLSKLGVQAIAATLSGPGVQGKPLVERWHYMAEFTRTVLSRTVASMNTAPARELAGHRYARMVALLRLWADESNESGVPIQGEFDFEIPLDYAGLSQE